MKKRTIYTLPKGSEPTGANISELIKLHANDVTTFAKLESYVDDMPIMDRDSPNQLLTINNFAQYITSINAGYLLGNPVTYTGNDDTDISKITDRYDAQSMPEIDKELEEDCSMFGQAFENVFIDENTEANSARLSPYNTIVVYDDTFKHNKMFAIYYSQHYENNKKIGNKYDIVIWTDTQILYRVLNGTELTDDLTNQDLVHGFGEVPVIHYMNTRRLKGDYEPVISLINAYNILQSDRVIDREKLVDAILAFYGSRLTAEDQQAIKDNRVIQLPEGAKAEYVIKQVNEADADVLRSVIAADIHKFSMTPDLTDEAFGNASSGVAILYKLLAFEQNVKSKERLFERGLATRFNLYAKVLKVLSKMSSDFNSSDVDIIFTRSLPKNNYETSQMINNLEGVVSNETLIGQLDFVKDPAEEMEKVKLEKEESNEEFGTPVTEVA